MGKYDLDQDPYCYDGTDVLRNRFGITNQSVLSEAEAEFTAVALDTVQFKPPPYDLSYLKDLHRQLFGNLYDWAGQTRNVDISKDNTRFCTFSRIEPEANKIFNELKSKRWLVNLDTDDFINEVAHYYTELNVIHPFREGNGRSQRLLFDHIALNCGYMIDWKTVTKEDWISANISGYHGKLLPLKNILTHALSAL